MKDMTGKDIKAGDILVMRGVKYRVSYGCGFGTYTLIPARGTTLILNEGLLERNSALIVGNIHDNPELWRSNDE